MIKLAISGCQGRMGSRILALAKEDSEFSIHNLLESAAHPSIGTKIDGIAISSDSQNLKGAQVLIEFTTPEATLLHLQDCVKFGVKMVIGTTGLNESQIAQVKKASAKIPIVFSSNMSVGVNILFKIAKEVAKTAKNYSVKIVETHHVHKKDAPSGTAKTLAKIIEEAAGNKVSDIQSIREGETIGDHDCVFDSALDTIIVRHHAKTRDIFAKGALVAAKFVARKKSGLFDMQEVLGLR